MVKLSRPRAPAVFRALFPGLADWLESPWAGPPQFTAAQSSARPDGGFGQRKVRLDLVAVAAAVFVPQLPGLSHLHPKFRDQLIAFGDQLPQPGVRGPQPGNRVSQSGRLTGHKERIGHTPHSTTAGPPSSSQHAEPASVNHRKTARDEKETYLVTLPLAGASVCLSDEDETAAKKCLCKAAERRDLR